jgi:hypothetical protein
MTQIIICVFATACFLAFWYPLGFGHVCVSKKRLRPPASCPLPQERDSPPPVPPFDGYDARLSKWCLHIAQIQIHQYAPHARCHENGYCALDCWKRQTQPFRQKKLHHSSQGGRDAAVAVSQSLQSNPSLEALLRHQSPQSTC